METDKKRLRDESNSDDQPEPIRPQPTFTSVIRGAMISETIREICLSLEPIIRRTIRDEVQNFIIDENPLHRNRQYYIENPTENPQPKPQGRRLKFIFTNQVPQQIYTSNKITDNLKNPLQIKIVDIETGEIDEGFSMKVIVVVIDGDLEEEDCDSDKFNSNIVVPRIGKGALLGGQTVITLNQGIGTFNDIYFRDNSKWIRSGKFRLGVRLTNAGNGLNIKEGITEKFVVNDHRGELNKKHYPPMLCLEDETWRLKKIAKEGKYHMSLKKNGINTVQDFLRKYFVNPDDLQNNILKMSENSWDKLINHAKKCPMGDESYLFRLEGNVIRFSPIGEILETSIGGISCSYNDLAPQQMANVKQLASQAYQQWNQLEKISIHLPLSKLMYSRYRKDLETGLL